MGKALRLLFNLHPGEGQRAALFILLGLLWSVGSYGTFVLSEGMFLEHVGAHALPKAYLAIALCMCLLSGVLLFSLNHLSIRLLLFFLIITWVGAILAFFLLYPTYHTHSTYWFLFKVFGWIIPISIYIVYWAFADQYFDFQDGKRFFGLLNSITFLGDAIGGGIISSCLDRFTVPGLMLLFVGTLLASLPFIFLIARRMTPVLEEHLENIHSTSSIRLPQILQTIFKSRFTLFLICCYFTMQLLAINTEFNYMNTFEKVFASSSDNALTVFIGKSGMWVALGNMVFCMFIYSRMVTKIGVNNMLLVAPSFFFLILCIWCFQEALPIAIFGMIAREGMVYSFDDNNLNLLLSGVPNKIKNQVRVSIESFIEPTGMLAGAALLFAFHEQALFLTVSISACAIVLVFFLRHHYPKALFRNLVAGAIRFEKKSSDYLAQLTAKERRQAEFLLLSHLKQGEEREQLIAYEYLLQVGHPRTLSRLLNHIGKISLPGKLKVIEMLSESPWAKENLVLERLDRWQRMFPHPAIKNAIHFYLARHGILRPERVMHDLNSEYVLLRAAAILTLKTTPYAFQFPSFCALASEQLALLLRSEKEGEICLGVQILGLEKNPASIEILLPFLTYPSLKVNRAAAKALSLVAHPDYKHLSSQLITRAQLSSDSEIRSSCLAALDALNNPATTRELILSARHFRPTEHMVIERIILKQGQAVASTLLHLVQDNKVADRCRLLAGKILGKLNRPLLQSHLFSLVSAEIERAYFYLYHAQTVQKQAPEHDLSILQKALYTGYQSIIDFIIQLLGVAGSLEECEVLSHTLKSPHRKTRAQAVETLEKACNGKLFDLLEPLIEESHPERKLRRYLKGGRTPLNLTELLDKMARSPSRADQIVSLAMKARLNTPDWQATLQKQLASSEDLLHHFAQELLEV